MKKYLLLFLSMSSLGFVLYLALIAALALPFQWAWNFLRSETFPLPNLSYGAAVALLTLVALVAVVARGVQMKAKVNS